MKTKYFYLLTAVLYTFFSGCHKDRQYSDTYFEVVTDTIVKINADTLEIRGRVQGELKSNIRRYGICYGTGDDSFPKLTENQILFDGSLHSFRVRVKVVENTTYYFRSFAADYFAIGISAPVKYVYEKPKPPVVPCSLPKDEVSVNGSSHYLDYVDQGFRDGLFGWLTDYQVICTGGIKLSFYFRSKPRNGIYTTTNDTTLLKNTAGTNSYVIAGLSGGSLFPAADGYKIYVTENWNGSLTFDFCSFTTTSGIEVKGNIHTN